MILINKNINFFFTNRSISVNSLTNEQLKNLLEIESLESLTIYDLSISSMSIFDEIENFKNLKKLYVKENIY